jgi:glycerol kinase
MVYWQLSKTVKATGHTTATRTKTWKLYTIDNSNELNKKLHFPQTLNRTDCLNLGQVI